MCESIEMSRAERGDVGAMLRDWRMRRRHSQMALALDVGVSPRHLSFVETGRSRPSPGVLGALAERLEVPLRERNRMFQAAGYAPRYATHPLDAAAMASVRAALDRLLRAHEPYPGLVLDRHWNVMLANRPALALTGLLPDFLRGPVLNVFRASLHPQGLSANTENFEDWAAHLLQALARAVDSSADVALAALAREVRAYPNVMALPKGRGADQRAEAGLLVPCVLVLPHGRLSMFTTLTTFGTPRDITLDEVSIELFYPADEATERLLRPAGAS